MTDNLTNKTAAGEVSAFPGLQDILSKAGLGNGWADLMKTPAANAMSDAMKEKREDLERDYQIVFDSPAGKRVLEDILDQTLRRSCSPKEITSIEADALYQRERAGQNNVAFYICTQVEKGRKLGPKSKKKAA